MSLVSVTALALVGAGANGAASAIDAIDATHALSHVVVAGAFDASFVLEGAFDAAKSLVLGGAREGAVNVDLDLTFVGQMVLFILLMLVLKPLLFDPMLKLFEEREKRIAGAKLEARKMDEESAGALTKYENAMAKARAEANGQRDKLRAEGTAIENELLGRVRAESSKVLEEGRARLAAERLSVETHLEREVKALARDMAAQALGREVRG